MLWERQDRLPEEFLSFDRGHEFDVRRVCCLIALIEERPLELLVVFLCLIWLEQVLESWQCHTGELLALLKMKFVLEEAPLVLVWSVAYSGVKWVAEEGLDTVLAVQVDLERAHLGFFPEGHFA